MTRPYSWFPLAASDPVPGDPTAVRTAGERYKSVADTIASSAASLTAIADVGTTTSDAVDAIRETADKVAGQITTARDRYAVVGSALLTYASQLERAQQESISVLTTAQSAQIAVDHSTSQITRALRALDEATSDEASSYQRQLTQARSSRDAAEATLARARDGLAQAIELRDRAAQAAIESIDGATSGDGLNDGWWENWGSKVSSWVSNVAGIISAVTGIASLFLGWVPILGQILVAVSLVTGIVALIADVLLAVNGEGSVMTVILDVAAVASFGIGRALASSAKASQASMRGVTAYRASARAARSGSALIRSEPALLIPARLKPAVAVQVGAGWRASSRALNAEIKELPFLERVAARMGSQELVLDMAALSDASRLAKNSTLVPKVLGVAGIVESGAIANGVYSGAVSGKVITNEYAWVSGFFAPEPDALRLDR